MINAKTSSNGLLKSEGRFKKMASVKFYNKIYNGDKLNNFGIQLCKEVGVEPETMIAKKLSHFSQSGLSEDVVRMSFMNYEERRKLKISMLEEFNKERAEMKQYDSSYLNPQLPYKMIKYVA